MCRTSPSVSVVVRALRLCTANLQPCLQILSNRQSVHQVVHGHCVHCIKNHWPSMNVDIHCFLTTTVPVTQLNRCMAILPQSGQSISVPASVSPVCTSMSCQSWNSSHCEREGTRAASCAGVISSTSCYYFDESCKHVALASFCIGAGSVCHLCPP